MFKTLNFLVYLNSIGLLVVVKIKNIFLYFLIQIKISNYLVIHLIIVFTNFSLHKTITSSDLFLNQLTIIMLCSYFVFGAFKDEFLS